MARNQATGQEVGAVYVSVMPSGQGFSRSMDRDFDNAFTGAATRGTATFGQMFRRVAAVGAAVLATLGIGRLIKNTIALGVSYNTLEQSSKAAFTTLLGTAEAAAEMQESIRAFAMTSPFPRQAFIQGSQQLLAFGVQAKKVIPILGAVQDAVAASGGSSQQLQDIIFVMAQISAAGKITGQDLIQFGQRGINAAELIGSTMGKTGAQIKAQITAGTLGADEALDALTKGMATRFAGAAQNLKQTWVGSKDRIAGAWRDLSSELVAPFVDPNGGGFAVKWANDFADLLRSIQKSPAFDTLKGKLNDFGKRVDGLVQGGLKTLALLFESDGPAKFRDAIDQIAAKFPGLQAVLSILDALHPILPAIMNVLPELAPSLEKLAPKFTDLVEALIPLIPPLVEAAVKLFPALIELIPPLVDVAIPLLELLIDLAPAIVAVAGALAWMVSINAGALGFLSDFFGLIEDGQFSVDTLAKLLYNIPGPLGDAARGIYSFMYGLIHMFADLVNGLVGGLENLLNPILAMFGKRISFGRWSPNLPSLSTLMSSPGSGGGATGRFGPVAMADSGTILPRPGGTLILAAEAGRAESVVDTGKLNNLIDAAANGSSGSGFRDLILQNPDPYVLLNLFMQRIGQKVRFV